jgi:hypothetical protein
MGIKQEDVEESLKDYFITKIDGQPSKEAISKLKLELSEGLESIPTLNGGGRYGHIGRVAKGACCQVTAEATGQTHSDSDPQGTDPHSAGRLHSS